MKETLELKMGLFFFLFLEKKMELILVVFI